MSYMGRLAHQLSFLQLCIHLPFASSCHVLSVAGATSHSLSLRSFLHHFMLTPSCPNGTHVVYFPLCELTYISEHEVAFWPQ